MKSRNRFRSINIEWLEDRKMLAASGPEVEFVYLVNRARHDPVAYQVEQNLPVSLSGVTPRGPVAFNSALFDSAEVKANDLVANNYFDHVSPAGVHANQLAMDAGYVLPSHFPADANFVESLAAGTNYDTAIEALNLLVIDEGVPSLGHRKQLLGIDDFYAANRDIGVGFSSSPTARYSNYWSIHIAQRAQPVNHLTGVVYEDIDGDGRYDNGEGLRGVTVTASGGTSVRTGAGGEWSIPAQDGEYTVTVGGGSYVGNSSVNATVSGDNVAVDFLSGRVSGQVSFSEVYGTNLTTPLDVNGKDGVSVLDALVVINHLAASGENAQPVYTSNVFLDVNGDNAVSVIDALQVINGLSRLGSRPASGEFLPTPPTESQADVLQSVDQVISKWETFKPGFLVSLDSNEQREAVPTREKSVKLSDERTDEITPLSMPQDGLETSLMK